MEDIKNILTKVHFTERGQKRHARIELLLKLMPFPVLQKSCTVKDILNCEHISFLTEEVVWVSDKQSLVLTETTTGNTKFSLTDVLHISWSGVHSVDNDYGLVYIDNNHSIKHISNDGKTTILIKRNDSEWKPQCLYCSPSTGELLIAMHIVESKTNKEMGKIIRYSRVLKHEQTIPEDKPYHILYTDPHYVTENNNGDVVVSDYWRGVVVTDHGGTYRFSYTKPPSGINIMPRGICTDSLSHILVCDRNSETVQIIDKNGEFLSYLFTKQTPGLRGKPCSISYDDKTRLVWVGLWNKTVSVYRHINAYFDLLGKFDGCFLKVLLFYLSSTDGFHVFLFFS